MAGDLLLAYDEYVEVRDGTRTVFGFVRAQNATGFRLEVHELRFEDRRKTFCGLHGKSGKAIREEVFPWGRVRVLTGNVYDGVGFDVQQCDCWHDNGVTISEFYRTAS